MTKAELIDAVFQQCDGDVTKKSCAQIVDNVFEQVARAVKKDKRFSQQSFGTFHVRTHKARQGRNPQTGEPMKIKASKSVGFRCAKALKDRL